MKILNVEITTLSKKEILEKISLKIKNREKTVIFTPNPEMIEFVSKDILNTSDFNLPDGIGLKIACNLKVIHGIDFMLDLCAEAEKNGWTVGLLGGMNNVADRTKNALLQKFPRLKINYVCDNFRFSVGDDLRVVPLVETQHAASQRKNTPTPSGSNSAYVIPQGETQHIASLQNRLSPTTYMDILFVALGTPKEQLWILQNRDTFPATVFMEVGGSFDILSGNLKRAPLFLRKLGLEWLFRLLQEPRRLPRQLRLIKFLWHVLTTKNSIEIL